MPRLVVAGRRGRVRHVADYDRDGNIYVDVRRQEGLPHYLTTLAHEKSPSATTRTTAQPTGGPGFSTPVQVDRDAVRTTVFPWLTAGRRAGRVAVAFYGTPSDGNPNVGTFKARWDVYVNQSLERARPALDPPRSAR